MRLTRLPGAVLAALAAVAALLLGQPLTAAAATPAAAAADPVRIMPLGDSITGSPGCWRALLWNQLQDTGYADIDFVGTLPAQGCGVDYDGDNEGHGGYLATNIANQNLLPGWLSATSPDVVLMHLGTNDVWSNIAPDTILAAFTTLVNQMRANNPDMTVLVAQIIPMNPSTCAECAQRAVNFNARIPAWADALSTAASPVRVVDQWTGFDTATDTYDGVHPNDAGNVKMAARWYDALTPVLDGLPTDPGDPDDPGDPGTGAACTATTRTIGSWNGGWQGEVTVTNSGSSALSGWRVTFVLPSGVTVSQVWNGTYDATAGTVTNAAWNGGLAPGATAAFGYIAASPAGTPAGLTASCAAA
ncbi:GDSL-type esterase/lipase family protein [Streptomyces hoynatensis]|uniref:Cellulose-binding protein n=1 Tax=Streptomyces hoynatensis TaxID=1141874 RepID=A0A3A9ZEJ7_9ACTN|nr:GDSL-type esterase/lipase family protein [Streptomyces hoynatensis]RKN46788.1 cellulose-binding protein [Streptomyces hoynatensis]